MTEFFAFVILLVAVVLLFAPIPVFIERYWWPGAPAVYTVPQRGGGCGMVIAMLVALLVVGVCLFAAMEAGAL